MKHRILYCLFFLSTSCYSIEFPQVNCSSFEEYTQSIMSTSKTYYRGSWNWDASAVVEKPSQQELIDKLNSFNYQDMWLGTFDLRFNHELAAKEEFPVAYDKITVEGPTEDKVLVKRSYIPKIIVKTNSGYLTAIHKGEWGGELLFVSDNKDITFIDDLAVEDMFHYENGFVIISGSGHMISQGKVFYLEFKQGNPKLTKLFGLIDAPRSSWKLKDGSILINSTSGAQILSPNSKLSRVECTS